MPMNPPRTMARSATTTFVIAVYVALSAAALGCGGNDSNSTTTTTTVVAAFTPDTPTPADGSITLLQGTTTGANINVRVTVTEVASFFGAGFTITYDPTALLFNGMDDSTSCLRDGVIDPNDLLFLSDATVTPGEIVITATRIHPEVPLAAAPTADLVILNFTARRTITPGDTTGRLDFAAPKQVCDGSVAPPDCGAIAVTWSGGAVTAQ
jgi:hypothetical protein